MYDVILFDLDGTLTDSKDGIIESIQHALSELGIRESNVDKLVSFIGVPLIESFRKHYSLDATQARRGIELYRKHYADVGIQTNAAYPGIPELLEELNAQGKRLIIATVKATVFAENVLKYLKLLDYFVSVVGGDLDTDGTSKTEIVRRALSQSKVTPKQKAVMVGDRKHDVIAAHSSGIDSIAVTYGYGSLEEIRNANPTYCARSVEELKELLMKSPS